MSACKSVCSFLYSAFIFSCFGFPSEQKEGLLLFISFGGVIIFRRFWVFFFWLQLSKEKVDLHVFKLTCQIADAVFVSTAGYDLKI